MPCRLSPRSATLEMSASSVGSTRSSASNSSTSTPSRAYADAISAPDAPAPTTAIVAGSSVSAHASSVPITRPPNCVPGIGFLTDPVASTIVFAAICRSADRNVPPPASERLALDQLDPVLLEQPGDAAGQRLDHLLAPCADGREVDLRLADLDPELAGVADLGEHVGDAQHRLRGNARVVQAAATDLVLLDHRGLHPELGGADRGDVAARARADHDAVVSGIGHYQLSL